jgi:hypothetical protein
VLGLLGVTLDFVLKLSSHKNYYCRSERGGGTGSARVAGNFFYQVQCSAEQSSEEICMFLRFSSQQSILGLLESNLGELFWFIAFKKSRECGRRNCML